MDIRSYFSTNASGSSVSPASTAEETQSDEPNASKRVCSDRRYNSKWEKDFPWLEFNKDVQGAFCKVCKKWAQETRHRSRGVWTTEPFMNWKKGPEKMRIHEQGTMHITACSAALEFENSERHGSAAEQLRLIGEEERVRNRKCIESLIRCITSPYPTYHQL